MSTITKVTRRVIFDLFQEREENEFVSQKEYQYPYNGRLDEVEFLTRLYNVKELESTDRRFKNAFDDIRCHTYYSDYPYDWLLVDNRFNLLEDTDSMFLKFICEIFHPEVRDENKNWKSTLDSINELLRIDGFEIYVSHRISERDVYDWRRYDKSSSIFIPFSERNKSLLSKGKISLEFTDDQKYQINMLLEKYNEMNQYTTETGYNYVESMIQTSLNEIKKFYKIEYTDNVGIHQIEDIQTLMEQKPLHTILDVIEVFSRKTSDQYAFTNEINIFFKRYNVEFELKMHEVIWLGDKKIELDQEIFIDEAGVETLLTVASDLFDKGEYANAVEKLWDAFERIKTFYSPELDKRKSSEKIVANIGKGNEKIQEEIQLEFKKLTDIGNEFRIRHHEKGKLEINDNTHYRYLYNRCLSLIGAALAVL